MVDLCASMATPVGERNASMYPGVMFCTAKLSLPGAAFSMMSIGEMYQ